MEWHPALAVLLGGEQTVFRGHQGVRESIKEEDEALAMYQVEISEIQDLGDSGLRTYLDLDEALEAAGLSE